MAARASGYFGIPFKVYHGVTQGDTPSPTIFNVVVYAIICYLVMVLAPTDDGTYGLGLLIQYLAAYFYADDGLVALTQSEKVQIVFDVLAGLFKQVVLWTNARKTAGMACQPFHTPV